MTDERYTKDEFAETLDLSHIDSTRPNDATLEPTIAPRFRRESRRERLAEARAKLAAIEGTGNTIRVKSPIAEGGMGRVLLAEQGGLRRDVAVKTLRDEFLDADFSERLTREARITGLVEHPNIVPVYALQNDDRGAPMMVMKNIEGVSWRTVIRDPAHPMLESDRGEALDFHLRVLMSVCDAVSFAHSRGVLHLDIKPDNVMLGAFHDVYLVDWGVACSMRDEHRGFLPLVDETTEILGTPAYLAPEMVDPKLAKLGVHTDVFLLGAALYESLTKKPPYRGGSVRDILYEAYLAKPPEFEADVPPELAAIVRRAMSAKPENRYPTAESFRSAISRYMRHRGSNKLATEGSELLASLATRIASGNPIDAAELADMTRRFSECRFSFAHALREWPENVHAADGLAEATIIFAELCSTRGEHATAASLLDELRDTSPRFASRIAAIRERSTRASLEVEKLRELRDDSDDVRSRFPRAIYVLVIVGVLVLPMFAGWGLERAGIYRWAWWHSLVYTLLLLVVGTGGAMAMRRALMPNRVSRRFVLAFGFITLSILCRRGIAYILGHHDFEDIAMDIFLFGVGCGVIGLLTDRRFFSVAIACMTAGLFVAIWPAYALLFIGIAGVVGPGTMAGLWIYSDRRRRKEMRD